MSRSSKFFITIAIVGVCVLGGLSIAGNSKSESAKRAAIAAEANTRIVQQNTARTECIRGIAAELDHGRWALVGQAFNATSRADAQRIGALLSGLPLITDLADHGGAILGERVGACPPATTKGTP
jgi:hypothetical protein